MATENSNNIVRLTGGSIDYQYYAEQGVLARNREIKNISGRIQGTCRKAVCGLLDLPGSLLSRTVLDRILMKSSQTAQYILMSGSRGFVRINSLQNR
ncbi:MAG: hypothetical protein OEY09_12000 [Gammaproteobacteria bacterium]|nr:hypothetical protein [Gammaproteobacteria bacterium]